MKNFAKFFVSVAVLFVGVSCATDSTEDLGQQVVGKGQTVLTVSTDGEVRTSLGDKNGETYPIYWSEGDQLSLNGVASSKLEGVGENATTATFTWDGTFDAPFCVAYPASKAGVVTFAASQKYVEGTFAPKAMPMYGYNDVVGAESVELHYLAGVLRIGLYADEETTIKSMYVENLEGTPIAGAFNCDFANGGAVTPAEGAVSTISYDAKGVVLSQSEAAPTLFHITVPEGYYEVLRLTIITDKGTMIAKVRAGEESAGGKIVAGVVREFTTKKFNTNSGTTLEIESQADLETLRVHIAESTLKNYDIVRVTADFAVEGWTEPIDGFDGMLDGNNHTISGLTAPLFGELKGAVSNLNLAAAISVSNEENVGIVARSMSADAILRNCNTSGTLTFTGGLGAKVGGLVGATELGATISECTNDADLTVTGEAAGSFGGITGRSYAYLLHCKNTGAILFDSNMVAPQELFVGGITGANFDHYMQYCTNDAPITFSGTVNDNTDAVAGAMPNQDDIAHGEFYIGGLAGKVARAGSGNVTPSNCENTENGDITIGGNITLRYQAPAEASTGGAATTANFQAWGGLFGRLNQNGPQDCVNRGDILVNATFANDAVTDSRAYISPWVGGIYGHGTVGLYGETENRGNITWTSDCNFDVLLGGLFGRSTSATDAGKNFGTVKFDAETTANVYMGGCLPILNAKGQGFENHGVVEFAENAKAAKLYIGGYVGSGNFIYTTTENFSVHYGIADGKNYGKVIVNGDTTSNPFISGICGYVGAAALTNCQNLVDPDVEGSGSITVGSTASFGAAVYLGGVIGSHASSSGSADIVDCTNAGTISFNGDAVGKNILIGGVAGGAPYTNGTVSGCDNTGNVTVSSDTSCSKIYMGGVVGAANNLGAINISDCVNGSEAGVGGAITLNATTTSNMYAGGVIGYTTTSTGVTTCTNYATILIDATNGATAYIGGILGQGAGNGQVANLYNYGDITANGSKAVTCGGIGALSGNNEITNSESICNLKSNDASVNLGMFNGYAATHKGRKVTNSKVGGTIQRAGDEAPVTITNDNFSGYLFSGNTQYPTTEGTDYENITVVTPSTEE